MTKTLENRIDKLEKDIKNIKNENAVRFGLAYFLLPFFVSVLASLIFVFLINPYDIKNRIDIELNAKLPMIDIYPNGPSRILLSTQFLTDIRQEYSPGGQIIEICAINKGQSDALDISITLDYNNTVRDAGSVHNFQKLEPNSPECFGIKLIQKDCYILLPENTTWGCDPSQLKEGNLSLNFTVTCKNCREGKRISYLSLDACIWKESGGVCQS